MHNQNDEQMNFDSNYSNRKVNKVNKLRTEIFPRALHDAHNVKGNYIKIDDITVNTALSISKPETILIMLICVCVCVCVCENQPIFETSEL